VSNFSLDMADDFIDGSRFASNRKDQVRNQEFYIWPKPSPTVGDAGVRKISPMPNAW
jgi:hypothetical protein